MKLALIVAVLGCFAGCAVAATEEPPQPIADTTIASNATRLANIVNENGSEGDDDGDEDYDTDRNRSEPDADADADADVDVRAYGEQNQVGIQSGTTTALSIGIQSKLIVAGGNAATIYFEVTNLRDQPIYYFFQVTDENKFLRQLAPQQSWITAGQTMTVTLTAFIPPNTATGTRDRITFTSQGQGSVSQSVYLTVADPSSIQDSSRPTLTYLFSTQCEAKYVGGNCGASVWSLEVTAQDKESGLLRFQSTPRGLVVRNTFTAGTKEPVKATYTASCCQRSVTVSAHDLAGNSRSATIDNSDILLTDAAIAAIVLGVVLLAALILLLVICVCWRVRKNRADRDLPRYPPSSSFSSSSAAAERRRRTQT